MRGALNLGSTFQTAIHMEFNGTIYVIRENATGMYWAEIFNAEA
jgi:hypothetical protein